MRRFLLLFLSVIPAASGQVSSFPRPDYFRETFFRSQPRIELQGPVKLQDHVASGKLELSLKAYLELVMANNTDIAIQRLSVSTAADAVTRAFGIFDPLLTGSFNSTRTKKSTTDALAGASTQVTLSQPANFNFTELLSSGMQYNVNFGASKSTTNSSFATLNPALGSNLGFSFSQPLIRNRGSYINHIQVTMARSRLRKTEYDLKTTLLGMITDAENAYWDLVQARQNLAVAEKALELSDQALKRSQLELKLGALSPLDIYQPEQVYATSQIAVSQAKFTVEQAQNALRRQIGADLDPDIRNLPIAATETVLPPASDSVIDPEAALSTAVANRPDLKSATQSLDVDDLQIRNVGNQLLPDLSVTGAYTTQGTGGILYRKVNVFDQSGNASSIVQVLPGGFSDTLDQMFGFGYPVYAFGVTLRLPIRSHAAAADMADAIISKHRDTLAVRTTRQQIRLDILQAVSQVESSKASVKLAQVALDFAQKRLDAEQKKYDLGTSTIYFVLQAQQDLVTAQSTLVQNSVQYRRNLLNLLRREGTLLEERGIVIQ